jgi:pyruvate/2-oxoglutarate dehydrogenase complex dihydrolipoamide dehydrogenase (E3) component
VPGIWAVGDVNGRTAAFTHTSYNDFEIVAANIFDNEPRRIPDRIPCYGLSTDRALGRVGMTEHELRATGIKALITAQPTVAEYLPTLFGNLASLI